MQNKSMDGELYTSINTLQDKWEALEQIDILLNGLNTKDDLSNLTNYGKEIQHLGGKSKEPEQFYIQLKEELLSMPTLRLTLAFQPNEKQISEISLAVKNTIDQKAILDFHIDTFLVGGALVEYNGHYFDGSLASKFA
jgi:hypothetical protein